MTTNSAIKNKPLVATGNGVRIRKNTGSSGQILYSANTGEMIGTATGNIISDSQVGDWLQIKPLAAKTTEMFAYVAGNYAKVASSINDYAKPDGSGMVDKVKAQAKVKELAESEARVQLGLQKLAYAIEKAAAAGTDVSADRAAWRKLYTNWENRQKKLAESTALKIVEWTDKQLSPSATQVVESGGLSVSAWARLGKYVVGSVVVAAVAILVYRMYEDLLAESGRDEKMIQAGIDRFGKYIPAEQQKEFKDYLEEVQSEAVKRGINIGEEKGLIGTLKPILWGAAIVIGLPYIFKAEKAWKERRSVGSNG
jgi:hypothetical protein